MPKGWTRHGPFRGSRQEQMETEPETGLETQLQHGPKSTQEMGLKYLSLTKLIKKKKKAPHSWDLLTAQGPSPHLSSQRSPLPKHLQVGKNKHLNLVTNTQKADPREKQSPRSSYPARARKADPVAGYPSEKRKAAPSAIITETHLC